MDAMLFLLLVGHYLADFPLQGEFLAIGKNRNTELGKTWWIHCLTGHAMIHGGFVAIITGNMYLGLAETIMHWLTDFFKCENKISLDFDQCIHIGCKILWVLVCYNFL